MMLAFIVGMVFLVALIQTLLTANTISPGMKPGPVVPVLPGDHDPPASYTIPNTGNVAQKIDYRLVQACPEREAIILILCDPA